MCRCLTRPILKHWRWSIRTGSWLRRKRSATATDETLLSFLGLPQRLALSYCPARTRESTLALLALDSRMADLVRRKGDPILGQMRLAWWRDTLGNQPETWPRGEPVLGALAGWEDRSALVDLVNGWELLFGEDLNGPAISEFAEARGGAFASLTLQIGEPLHAASARQAGRVWALGDLATNLQDNAERALVIGLGRSETNPAPLPRSLRPLAVLSGLARRSLSKGGAPLLDGPASGLLALRLGLCGR